jgi:hypothetical protein
MSGKPRLALVKVTLPFSGRTLKVNTFSTLKLVDRDVFEYQGRPASRGSLKRFKVFGLSDFSAFAMALTLSRELVGPRHS